MRDPDRIQTMIELLRAAWKRSPELRLGQLIEIAHEMSGSSADIFSIEDDQLLDGLRCLAKGQQAGSANQG